MSATPSKAQSITQQLAGLNEQLTGEAQRSKPPAQLRGLRPAKRWWPPDEVVT